jgi:hypothetical protein
MRMKQKKIFFASSHGSFFAKGQFIWKSNSYAITWNKKINEIIF